MRSPARSPTRSPAQRLLERLARASIAPQVNDRYRPALLARLADQVASILSKQDQAQALRKEVAQALGSRPTAPLHQRQLEQLLRALLPPSDHQAYSSTQIQGPDRWGNWTRSKDSWLASWHAQLRSYRQAHPVYQPKPRPALPDRSPCTPKARAARARWAHHGQRGGAPPRHPGYDIEPPRGL